MIVLSCDCGHVVGDEEEVCGGVVCGRWVETVFNACAHFTIEIDVVLYRGEILIW